MFRAFSQGSSCCDAGTLNLAVFECWQSWPTTMRTINYSEVTDRASLVAQIVKNLPAAQETQLNPCIGAILQRREWQPTLVFSPGEFHWQRNLVGYSPWCRKESDMTEQLNTHQETHTQNISFDSWKSDTQRRTVSELSWTAVLKNPHPERNFSQQAEYNFQHFPSSSFHKRPVRLLESCSPSSPLAVRYEWDSETLGYRRIQIYLNSGLTEKQES